MSEYKGKHQHGQWWMHCNGTLQRNTPGITTSKKFELRSPHVIKTWNIRCELDWYRMMRQYNELREGTIPPLVA